LERAYREFIQHYEKLTALAPNEPGLHSELGAGLNELATALMRREQWDEARQYLQEAIKQQQLALKLRPGDPQYARFLRNHYANLAQVAERQGDHAEATKAVEEAEKLLKTMEKRD
jgi:tetratricopeptide (TPR) repeat protein